MREGEELRRKEGMRVAVMAINVHLTMFTINGNDVGVPAQWVS